MLILMKPCSILLGSLLGMKGSFHLTTSSLGTIWRVTLLIMVITYPDHITEKSDTEKKKECAMSVQMRSPSKRRDGIQKLHILAKCYKNC